MSHRVNPWAEKEPVRKYKKHFRKRVKSQLKIRVPEYRRDRKKIIVGEDAIDAETEAKAWAASRTWAHAQKYCRENPE